MTPKVKEIVEKVLAHWRMGKLYKLPHVRLLIQLCRELEGEL